MKKEITDLSRRNFLTRGTAAVAAGASIIAIPALGATKANGAENSTALMTNDPVYTESVQTLINKTIASADNILGTDAINIKEFSISGADITVALGDAIAALGATGGQIIIPRGVWETEGGHVVTHAISIEGVGINSGIPYMGSVIKLKEKAETVVFKMLAPTRNVSFKNFAIDMNDTPTATGILMTDVGGTSNYIYNTQVENVGIYGGAYGIKIESASTTQFESNLNNFTRICFVGCRTSFYSNTVNSGYTFDNCHFYLPTIDENHTTGGTALHCHLVGNLTAKHCVFAGSQANAPLTAVTDNSIILKTVGMYNTINFYDCQDENVHWAYQNDSNPWYGSSIIYRNCLIQSHLKFNSSGGAVLDSCRCAGSIYDSSTASVRLQLEGHWNFYGYDPITTQQNVIEDENLHIFLTNSGSQLLYDKVEPKPTLKDSGDIETGGYYIVNNRCGAVEVLSGTNYVQVYNTSVTPDSVIFLQLRSYDSGGARIRDVTTYNGSFVIALTQNAASNLSVGFLVQG